MKNTVATFRQAKGREKLVMLTAYDYSTAKLMDRTGVNALLVGDSLGMVMLGWPDTLSVTLEDMIRHCAAVARGSCSALVVCDMPFMSCQISVADTVRNAGRLVKEGRAQAVKLEGGAAFCDEVRALTRAAAQKLLDDARALQEAGAFSLVLECVPAALAARVSKELEIPVIGIGAGPECDGQVLVWQDMLGLCDTVAPKFVKRFGEVGEAMRAAFTAYAQEVKDGTFPAEEHCYSLEGEAELLEKLY